jgi:hypothetical protein
VKMAEKNGILSRWDGSHAHDAEYCTSHEAAAIDGVWCYHVCCIRSHIARAGKW